MMLSSGRLRLCLKGSGKTDIAGLMGAYGCALIAKEHYIEAGVQHP